MVTDREAALAAASALAEEFFEAVLTEESLHDSDTRAWSWSMNGRLFVTGLVARLAEQRCEHLDGVVPRPAFGVPWAPGLACVDCVGPAGDGAFARVDPETVRCTACGARRGVVELRPWQILRGAYVLGVLLCPGCEAMCRDA